MSSSSWDRPTCRLVAVGVALFLVFWLLGKVGVGVRPLLLALLVSTVLWPPWRGCGGTGGRRD